MSTLGTFIALSLMLAGRRDPRQLFFGFPLPPSRALSSTIGILRDTQSRLIHTAPVFQPEVDKSARRHMWETVGGTNRAGGRKRDTAAAYWATGAQRELDRLNAAFSAVKGRMATQKLAAQKWIRRQRIRMEVGTLRVIRWQLDLLAWNSEAVLLAVLLVYAGVVAVVLICGKMQRRKCARQEDLT